MPSLDKKLSTAENPSTAEKQSSVEPSVVKQVKSEI